MKTITELRNQREELQKAMGEYMHELGLWDNRMTSIERKEEMLNDEANQDLQQARDEGYQKGLDDAWELAKKIVLNREDGGLSGVELEECYDFGFRYILTELSASEAKAKYDAWKAKKGNTVRVGDVVHTKRSDRDMVVTGIVGSTPTYHVTDIRYGTCTLVLRNEFVTTGKHYDLPWLQDEKQENQNDTD